MIGWRWRTALAVSCQPAPIVGQTLDRRALLKGIGAILLLLMLFATPVPRAASAMAVAALILISRIRAGSGYFASIDWPLLILFASLFVVTGAFASSGIGVQLGGAIAGILAGNELALLAISAIGSNSIGNVPMVAALLGLMPDAGPGLLTGLALYATLAGNLLLIGSLANIIMAEQARKEGIAIGFLLYLKDGLPIGMMQLLAALALRALLIP